MAATTNSTKAPNKVVSPTKLAHVVLRTNNLEKMLDFYCTFLGGHVVHHADSLSFMTYDDEHHRIAFIQTPYCQEKIKNSNGLEVRGTPSATPNSLKSSQAHRIHISYSH